MRGLLIVLFIAALQVGQAVASPALTSFATIMRTAPSARARAIQAIPSNAEIDVSNCGRYWCYVSWQDRSGYVTVNSVATLPDTPVSAAPPIVVAPYYGWGYPYGWGGGFYHRGWHRW
jgi:hypothetical protein